ncbi:MAG TPA: tRNA (cytidine(34)-2'-O)-methyltransferase [Rhodospirillaceae bacterium]|nr:tRNA (cytidine(34)-2'-O)-methyltransferase [Rhodospirillaceae bacterium]
MRITLFQPDIPQNVGAIIRLAACFGLALDIIEPCGFLWDDRRIRRVGMDYLDFAEIRRYPSWDAYLAQGPEGRLILLTTKGDRRHLDFRFAPDDRLLFGRESSGVPPQIHEAAQARLRIPLREAARSLNLAMTAAMVVGEALRQTDGWPVI